MENVYIEPKDIETEVFEALGQASMCWSETPKGVFNSTNAEKIGKELLDNIRYLCISFGEFRIFERDKLMKLKAEGEKNIGHISFIEWYNTIYKKSDGTK